MSRFKKYHSALAIALFGVPAATMAHDVGAIFESRGACESTLAQINTQDRKFLVEIGEFETEGEANRWFHEVFHCEQQGDQWVLVFEPEEQ